jgi:hypothetical protein
MSSAVGVRAWWSNHRWAAQPSACTPPPPPPAAAPPPRWGERYSRLRPRLRTASGGPEETFLVASVRYHFAPCLKNPKNGRKRESLLHLCRASHPDRRGVRGGVWPASVHGASDCMFRCRQAGARARGWFLHDTNEDGLSESGVRKLLSSARPAGWVAKASIRAVAQSVLTVQHQTEV